jgi:hypothetical protein
MLFGITVAVYYENHTEHTDTVRTSQEAHYVSAKKTNRLMLFGKTVAVYSKSKSHYDRQLVGQSVLVSGANLGPATNFSVSLRFSFRQLLFVML